MAERSPRPYHASRMHFSDIHRVGRDHLQFLFRELPVVDVRSCEKMLAGFQIVLNLSTVGGKVGHNPVAFLTVQWSDLPRPAGDENGSYLNCHPGCCPSRLLGVLSHGLVEQPRRKGNQ